MAGGAYILDYGDSFETSKKDAVIGGVQCVGTEPELTECFHASFGDHNCGPLQNTPLTSCPEGKYICKIFYTKLIYDGQRCASTPSDRSCSHSTSRVKISGLCMN